VSHVILRQIFRWAVSCFPTPSTSRSQRHIIHRYKMMALSKHISLRTTTPAAILLLVLGYFQVHKHLVQCNHYRIRRHASRNKQSVTLHQKRVPTGCQWNSNFYEFSCGTWAQTESTVRRLFILQRTSSPLQCCYVTEIWDLTQLCTLRNYLKRNSKHWASSDITRPQRIYNLNRELT
jgi:hypothetical protein